jgi:Bardet-Biedl syndrome 1 protein
LLLDGVLRFLSAVPRPRPSSLVIGTENREVLILNTAGSATAVRVQLPSVPVFMSVSGTFDVEYRIVVACRNNNVYTVKVGYRAQNDSH